MSSPTRSINYALFLFMAFGGIGGVMLAGYTFILRAG